MYSCFLLYKGLLQLVWEENYPKSAVLRLPEQHPNDQRWASPLWHCLERNPGIFDVEDAKPILQDLWQFIGFCVDYFPRDIDSYDFVYLCYNFIRPYKWLLGSPEHSRGLWR